MNAWLVPSIDDGWPSIVSAEVMARGRSDNRPPSFRRSACGSVSRTVLHDVLSGGKGVTVVA
jgi:hypothetical protein